MPLITSSLSEGVLRLAALLVVGALFGVVAASGVSFFATSTSHAPTHHLPHKALYNDSLRRAHSRAHNSRLVRSSALPPQQSAATTTPPTTTQAPTQVQNGTLDSF